MQTIYMYINVQYTYIHAKSLIFFDFDALRAILDACSVPTYCAFTTLEIKLGRIPK